MKSEDVAAAKRRRSILVAALFYTALWAATSFFGVSDIQNSVDTYHATMKPPERRVPVYGKGVDYVMELDRDTFFSSAYSPVPFILVGTYGSHRATSLFGCKTVMFWFFGLKHDLLVYDRFNGHG